MAQLLAAGADADAGGFLERAAGLCRGAPFPHDTLCGGGSSVVATPAPGSANARGTSAARWSCGRGGRAQHYAYRPGELAALNAMEYPVLWGI